MLEKTINLIDRFTAKTGNVVAALPLLLVLVQFTVVLMVYVFSKGSIQLQESLQYINALMFLGGAGYTALYDGHVRVDLFYSKWGNERKALVNLAGTLGLLVPFLVLLWITAIPYVADSWAIQEASIEASGLPFVYILKSTILLFAITLSLHAVADVLRHMRSLIAHKKKG